MTMRASGLLGRAVVEDGTAVGVVVDIRIAPADGGWEIVGLLVGPRKPLRLLGPYESDRSGPWIFGRLLRRRDRKVSYVEWSDVVEVGADSIRIRRSRSRSDRGDSDRPVD